MLTTTPPATYADLVAALDEGLAAVRDTFAGLGEAEWTRSTLLEPLDPALRPWTVRELAAHFTISIGLTLALVDGAQSGQTGRDRVSFFIFDRTQVAPVVYDYAVGQAQGRQPADLMRTLEETFVRTLQAAQSHAPDLVGPGYYALMRLDEFVASRIVEAVVHGLDLTDALGRDPLVTPRAMTVTAQILDELLARRTVPGRPTDLVGDDLAFIRAASGRARHTDPRLPLIG
jgi:uncharacterized protein (TIGR03083 family)